jgi:hypothetical protein
LRKLFEATACEGRKTYSAMSAKSQQKNATQKNARKGKRFSPPWDEAIAYAKQRIKLLRMTIAV